MMRRMIVFISVSFVRMIELSYALVKTPYAYPKGYNHHGYQQIVYQIFNYSGLLVARDNSPIPCVGCGLCRRRRQSPHPTQNSRELPQAVRSQEEKRAEEL